MNVKQLINTSINGDDEYETIPQLSKHEALCSVFRHLENHNEDRLQVIWVKAAFTYRGPKTRKAWASSFV
jgi:hypothetical protein